MHLASQSKQSSSGGCITRPRRGMESWESGIWVPEVPSIDRSQDFPSSFFLQAARVLPSVRIPCLAPEQVFQGNAALLIRTAFSYPRAEPSYRWILHGFTVNSSNLDLSTRPPNERSYTASIDTMAPNALADQTQTKITQKESRGRSILTLSDRGVQHAQPYRCVSKKW